jgi:hypothetical protein
MVQVVGKCVIRRGGFARGRCCLAMKAKVKSQKLKVGRGSSRGAEFCGVTFALGWAGVSLELDCVHGLTPRGYNLAPLRGWKGA